MITAAAVFAAARAEMSGPLIWGTCDCATAASAAWARLHGRDPLAAFSGRYSTATGALRILTRAGGYLAWCDTVFGAAGLRQVASDRVGDLALINCAGPFGAALAISLGDGRFASKAEAGMVVTKAYIQEAWTCRF
jgi:hypothetical protein